MSNKRSTEFGDLLALARQDLACYAAAQWPRFKLAAHHKLMISKLEAVERGEIHRLMILLPPRHGKTMICSGFFPAWYLGKHPDRQVILATYAQMLSDDYGRIVRNYLIDPIHQAIFPDCRLSDDSAAAHRFNTTHGGAYFAVGRGGSLTGRGAHLLLLDDPIKDNEEANSETIRRALHEWYTSVAYTRLMPGGAIVLIQTRWHEDDLAGRLLRERTGDDWEVLNLPAIAEQDDAFRKEGEALWPEQFPLDQLERIRATIGSRAWISLYQQRPAAAEGVVFKRNWWQFYRPPLTQSINRIVQSWDTAYKRGTENDFSVCTTWAECENGYYLLHLWRDRVEFPELKSRLQFLAGEWKPEAILIEDRASGQSLLQELKRESSLAILPVKVDGDKLSRAHAITPLIEAGRVFLPESAPWVTDFVAELADFPNGVHDDIVDSTTQALSYLRERRTTPSIYFGPHISPTLDKEEIWERCMRGYPITMEEFYRM